jgi:hypothetical protein
MSNTIRIMIAANLLGLAILGAALWVAQPFDTRVIDEPTHPAADQVALGDGGHD